MDKQQQILDGLQAIGASFVNGTCERQTIHGESGYYIYPDAEHEELEDILMFSSLDELMVYMRANKKAQQAGTSAESDAAIVAYWDRVIDGRRSYKKSGKPNEEEASHTYNQFS